MKENLHPKERFQVLKQKIMDSMMYAAFAGNPIRNKDALNAMMVVIARTRLFAT